jgi:hypothetical protein
MRTRDPWPIPTTPFTAAHVSALGVTEQRLRSAVAAGAIVRVRHGVYVAAGSVPEEPVALHLLRALAEQVVQPSLVASHDTAALALGLPLPMTQRSAQGPVHLTRPPTLHARSERSSARRLHLAVLAPHQVVTVPSGLVVTSVGRTALDVAAGLSLPEGLMLVDAAARRDFANLTGSLDRRHYANERLRRAALVPLEAAVEERRRGQHRLRALVGLADVRRESPLESLSFGHMVEAGLPVPRLQVPIRANGRTYVADFLWEQARVIGEADGAGKYADASAFVQEKVREGDLADLGYALVRWTGREMSATPQVVVHRIGRALVAGGMVL